MASTEAHVPAGLGVFEFVFIALLSHLVPEGRLLAALLGYRAIYYIVPLIAATVMYVLMEAHARKIGPARRRAEVAMQRHEPAREGA